ncbi:GNAT family N-acetyltransferase [Bauldia sp.]|uniref:GNAT family N-acetyltransferase n=1 Tax=Bauldia sp. TaxID=2575872 RepID=UPI003BA9F93C
MTDTAPTDATITVVSSLSDIAREDWDACANPDGETYNPFLAHDFLWSLEESGAATAKSGWLGQHLVLADGDGSPSAVLPCYLKSHSMGEYVFDAGWADAFERAGGRYYPKLQASVPFTPVTGRRLLVKPSPDADRSRAILAHGAATLAERHTISSVHVTFATESDWRILGSAGYLQRTDQQYHFFNDGYGNFDDFLAALASRKRKTIRRERRDATASGLEIVHLTGSDLTESVWDAFFTFYMDTGARKWGRPYLNRTFFSLIGERMADRILLIMAKRGDTFVAGALNMIGSDALYGRYWGTTENLPFLHFEICYYQAIDWAIAHKLARVEAGAQGEHKVTRGYRPLTTYSAHWIAHSGFRDAVEAFLRQERQQVARDNKVLEEYLPFKQSEETGPER